MSRTFRKCLRWVMDYNGDLYSCYKPFKGNDYQQFDEVFGKDCGRTIQGVSGFLKEVKCWDVDAFKHNTGVDKKTKQMHHRIDRQRAKQALDKAINDAIDYNSGNENNWITSFDPWSYD